MKPYRLPGERLDDDSGLDRLVRDLCRYFNGSEVVCKYHRHTPYFLTRRLALCGLDCSMSRAKDARRAPPFVPHTTRRTPQTEAALQKVAKYDKGVDPELFFAPDPDEKIMLRLSSQISHHKRRLFTVEGKQKMMAVRALRPSDDIELALHVDGFRYTMITGEEFNRRF